MQKEREQRTSDRALLRMPRLLDPAYILLLVAVLIAAGFIFKLTKQNAWLRAEAAKNSSALLKKEAIQVGDVAPAFKTQDLTGRATEVTYNGATKSLIYIFSPSCSSCAEAIPQWNRIAATAQSKGYRVSGVSLDPLEDTQSFFQGRDVRFQVLIMPNNAIARAFRPVTIPEVVLVSAQGTVEWVHYGPMTESAASELLTNVEL